MIEIILTLMVIVVAIIVLFWVKKALFLLGFMFKIFTIAIILSFFFTIFFGYNIIKDANDFKNNFPNSTNIILAHDTVENKGMVSGVMFNPEDKTFEPISTEQLQFFQNKFKDGEFESINEEYYKIFLIDVQSFEDMELNHPQLGIINLSKEEIQIVMLSDNAKEDLAKIISNKTGISSSKIESELNPRDEDIKNYILTYYISELFEPTNLPTFLKQIKTGEVQVYENTALFRAIRLLPNAIISRLVN